MRAHRAEGAPLGPPAGRVEVVGDAAVDVPIIPLPAAVGCKAVSPVRFRLSGGQGLRCRPVGSPDAGAASVDVVAALRAGLALVALEHWIKP